MSSSSKTDQCQMTVPAAGQERCHAGSTDASTASDSGAPRTRVLDRVLQSSPRGVIQSPELFGRGGSYSNGDDVIAIASNTSNIGSGLVTVDSSLGRIAFVIGSRCCGAYRGHLLRGTLRWFSSTVRFLRTQSSQSGSSRTGSDPLRGDPTRGYLKVRPPFRPRIDTAWLNRIHH